MAKYIFRCKECGSTDIQILAWVNPNTNEIIDDEVSDGKCWCEKCHSRQNYECVEIEEL